MRARCKPRAPSSSRVMMLPSTYSVLAGRSIMSEAFTTLGWVISVSQTEANSAATGAASPAWPPISAPIPVGTSRTALKLSVFSTGRRTNRKRGAGLGRFKPASGSDPGADFETDSKPESNPASQWYPFSPEAVTANRIGMSPSSI